MTFPLLSFVGRAGFTIPEASKSFRGGEDGYFLASNGWAVGVADGVGSWASHGVNPAVWTWTLMQQCRLVAESLCPNASAFALLTVALEKQFSFKPPIPGSCTAAIVTIKDGSADQKAAKKWWRNAEYSEANADSILSMAHIGDSGIILYSGEDGSIRWRSTPQQTGFNCPLQLDALRGQTVQESLRGTEIKEITVRSKDVVVLGTDGLFDNVFDDKIGALVKKALDDSKRSTDRSGFINCSRLAEDIAPEAGATYSNKQTVDTPWFREASLFYGSNVQITKPDDVTVVVAQLGYTEKKSVETGPNSVPEQLSHIDYVKRLRLDGTDSFAVPRAGFGSLFSRL